MAEKRFDFEDVARFHGLKCPGLAFGFRVSQLALQELVVDRSEDEQLHTDVLWSTAMLTVLAMAADL